MEKCSYLKDGSDPSEIWCIKDGPYNGEDVCPATASTQQISTEPSVPPTPSPSTRVKIQYAENGEVFEQEDTYNNVTGEATLSSPAHGNNSAVEVIIQENTVVTEYFKGFKYKDEILTEYNGDCW